MAARTAPEHRSGQCQRRSHRAGSRRRRHRCPVAVHVGRGTRTPRGRPWPGDNVLRRGPWNGNPDPTGTDVIDFSKFLSQGDGVWWGQAAAEPRPLVDALILQSPRIGPIRTFTGLSWNDQLAVTMPSRVSMVSYGGLGELRELSRSGRLEVVPCHYSALPRMFAERRLPCDVGLVQVSPPDEHGRCSLGIGVDYVADALRHTPVLIAEINQRMPVTIG